MDSQHDHKRGLHVLEIIIVAVALLVIGVLTWRMLSGANNQTAPSGSVPSDTLVRWSYDGNAWAADNVAPRCPEPLTFSTDPTNLQNVTSVLYPGQERGSNYKPHGGFRLDNSDGNVTVRAIMDGYVTSGARYIEQGEMQYMFTITNSCGIAYRYDHLAALSPAFTTLADSLPAAKPDDSRTTDFADPIRVKAGDTIATAVGFKKAQNYGFDLGIYDYRKRNAPADNPAFASKHQAELSQAGYAVCWLDMFPTGGVNLRNLPAGDPTSGKSSDYCD